MTNKPMLSVELRSFLEGVVKLCAVYGPTYNELRALLDKPARQVPDCVGDLERFEADDGVFVRLGDVIDMLGNEKAAQHQGEPVPFAWFRFDDDQKAIFTRSKRTKDSEALYVHPTAYRLPRAEQPAPVAVVMPELSGEELEFLKSVHAYCGSKLHSCFGEDGSALWPRLEEIGLIKCLGSYKWELTFDAVAMGIKARLNRVKTVAVDAPSRDELIKMLRHFASCANVGQVGTAAMDFVAKLNGVKPLSAAAPKIEFVACTAYNMGGDGYAEQTQTCCGSCPGGCVANLNGVKA